MPHIPASSTFSRLRVLDLTRARAGPTCVKQLADFGADVIRIEAPAEAGDGITGERDGSDFQNLHRNKRCMTDEVLADLGYAKAEIKALHDQGAL